jgi:hypothetical protein
MPRVPVPVAPSVRLAAAPSVRVGFDPRLDEQAASLQRGLGQAAAVSADIAEREQAQANIAQVQEANAEFVRWRNDRLYGQNGYYNQKGKNALVDTGEILREYDAKAAALTAQMPSANAQLLFQRQVNEERGQFDSGVMRHFAEQKDAHYREQNESTVSSYGMEAIAAAGDETVTQNSFGNMEKAIRYQGQLDGTDEETLKLKIQKAKSTVYREQVDRLINAPNGGRVTEAKAWLDKHGSEMTPEDLDAARAKLQPISDKQVAIQFRLEMDKKYGIGKSTAEKLAEADARYASQPLVLELAHDAIMDADRKAQYAENEYQEGLTNDIYAVRYQGKGTIEQVLSKARTPEDVALIVEKDRQIRDAQRAARESSPEWQLEQSRAYISFVETLDADPNVVMTGKPLDLAVFLGMEGDNLNAAVREIDQRRNAIIKAGQEKVNYPTAVTFGKRLRDRTAAALDIEPAKRGKPDKWSDEQVYFHEQVMVGAEADMSDWVNSHNGQEPPPEVQEKIIGDQLKKAKYVAPGGYFSNPSVKEKFVLQMTPQERENLVMEEAELPPDKLWMVGAARTAYQRVHKRTPNDLDLKTTLADLWNMEGDTKILMEVYGPELKANEALLREAVQEQGWADTPENRLKAYSAKVIYDRRNPR